MKRIIFLQRYGYSILGTLVITILLTACHPAGHITAPATEDDIIQAVDSSRWMFTPNQVMPQVSRIRQLNGGFSFLYQENKLTVYLPYFGRAYGGADVLSGRGPLDFKSFNFTTDKRQVKEGGWKITFTPKDYKEVQTMNFVLYRNGSVHLDTTMTNRSAISYNGNIAPKK